MYIYIAYTCVAIIDTSAVVLREYVLFIIALMAR